MENSFLFTIPYKDFRLWDVKRYSKNVINSHFEVSRLGHHINQENEKIELSDFPDKMFHILGISNEAGMFDAYSEEGANFNQPYKVVNNGYIAYNPYRVNVGSIGIKTENLKGNLISPAYVVFSCKETLLPEFLFVLMKTSWFNDQVKENTSGSVRQNLTFDALSNIKIPVPSIEEQKKLVKAYLASTSVFPKNESDYFEKYNNLFVSKLFAYDYAIKENKGVLFDTVNLSALTRWDSWEKSTGLKSKIFKVVPFEKLIDGKPQYGANVRGVDTKCDYRYIRITDINEDGTLNDDVKYPEKIEGKFILKNNDFLIARSGNTVGKTYLYKEEIGKAIYAGYLVKYVINDKIALPEYVFYYTKSILFKNWVIKNQRIAGQPNINGQEYLAAPFILPPISVQGELIKDAKHILKLIKDEKESTRLAEIKAKQDFENAIFTE